MDLKEAEGIDPWRHWYYQHKLRATVKMISGQEFQRSRLVDVGAGSGFFAQAVGAHFLFDDINCIDTSYTDAHLGEREGVVYARTYKGAPGNVYLLMDVLEHVDDDVQLLRHYVDEAASGTVFMVTVPAFMSMWSPHDDFLEHRRRYTLSEIEAVCVSAGLQVRAARYLFAPTFPLVWITRMVRRGREPKSDLRQPGKVSNHVLLGFSGLELLARANRCFGTTAAVVGVKP